MVYILEALKSWGFYKEAAADSEVYFVRSAGGERVPLVWMRRNGMKSSSSSSSSSALASAAAAAKEAPAAEEQAVEAADEENAAATEETGEPSVEIKVTQAEQGDVSGVVTPFTSFASRVERPENAGSFSLGLPKRPSQSSRLLPPSPQERLVLLHCHGNATDIGMMMGPYLQLAKQLRCEVVGVEYSGYGAASGTPSARAILADAETAYNYVVGTGVPPNRIVAYGQSVGSGPALNLAAKKPLGGLVLHSPLLSGIKVIDPLPDQCCRPSCTLRCFDFLPNDREILKVQCPAFIMHGQSDDTIPFYHGARLAELTPESCRWPAYFPRRAGHNDLVEIDVHTYFKQMRGFFDHVRSRANEGGLGTPTKRPSQMEMRGTLSSASNRTATILPFAEPAVGPQDGLYAQLRREPLVVTKGNPAES